jgi:hypothetical protein
MLRHLTGMLRIGSPETGPEIGSAKISPHYGPSKLQRRLETIWRTLFRVLETDIFLSCLLLRSPRLVRQSKSSVYSCFPVLSKRRAQTERMD